MWKKTRENKKDNWFPNTNPYFTQDKIVHSPVATVNSRIFTLACCENMHKTTEACKGLKEMARMVGSRAGEMFMYGIWLQSWLLECYRPDFSVFLAQDQLPSWFVRGPRKLSHERNRNVLIGFQSIGTRDGKWWDVYSTPQSIASTWTVGFEAKASPTWKQSRPKMVPIRLGRPRDPNLCLAPLDSSTSATLGVWAPRKK